MTSKMKRIFLQLFCGITLSSFYISAATITIEDGGTNKFIAPGGTFDTTFKTGTLTNASTGVMTTDDNINVSLTGDLSQCYANAHPTNGSTITFDQTGTKNIPVKLLIGDGAATGAQTIKVTTGTITLSADGTITQNSVTGVNTIVMDKYGVLDLTELANDLTVAHGNVKINNPTDVSAAQIKWKFTTPLQTKKLIIDEEPRSFDLGVGGNVDAAKHFCFDLADATDSTVGDKTFIFARTATNQNLDNSTAPNVLNNNDNWTGINITQVANSTKYDWILNATYVPLIEWSSGVYQGTFDVFSGAVTNAGDTIDVRRLLRNGVLTKAYTITNNVTLNLQTFNLTGDQTITIADGKALTLQSTGGRFDEKLNFATTTSSLKLGGDGDAITSGTFTTAGSNAQGIIELTGSGTTLTVSTILGSGFAGKFVSVSEIKIDDGALLNLEVPQP